MEKIAHCLDDKNILLIFDNIEGPLNSDEQNFRSLLQRILDYCENVKILVTTKNKLTNIGQIDENIVYISKLSM